MNDRDDDVSGLFKAIGSKDKPFREFGTQATDAQERWPMFKTIGLEKRLPPPKLLQTEKKQWERSASVTPATAQAAANLAAPPVAKGPSLANKIATGLNKLNRSRTRDAGAPDLAHKTAPATAPALPATPRVQAPAEYQPALRAAPQNTHIATAETVPSPVAPATRTKILPQVSENHAAPLFHAAAPAVKKTAPLATGPFAKTGFNTGAKPGFGHSAPAGSGLFAKAGTVPVQAGEPAPPPPPASRLFSAHSTHSAHSATLAKAGTPANARPGRSLFGAPAHPPPESNALSSLFARLAEPEPAPSSTKKRSLFGRMEKP